MSTEERPKFAGEGDDSSAATTTTAPKEETKKKRQPISAWSTKKVTYTLRVANMCNGLLLILIGILIFVSGMVSVTFTTVTVAAYIVFFGLLILCLECNISNLAPKFRRNFGFMFSFIGRTVFLLFCATMCFALAVWLGYLIGAITCLNGLFNGYIICIHPAFKTGELSAKGNPYGGYTGGDAIMLDYVKKNPQIATQATGAAVSFAQAHPEHAMAVASAVASANKGGGAGGKEPNPFSA